MRGICRELVNKIQTLRKDSGLQVTDKIILKIQKDNIIEKAIFENQNYILNETLAENLEFVDSIEDGVEIQFDNINSKLYLTKIEVDMEITRYSDKDLKHFKSLIEGKIEKAQNDLALIKSAYMNDGDNGTEDTSPTFKAFEEGSQTMSKEANTQLAIRQEKFIRDLQAALIKLRIKHTVYVGSQEINKQKKT